MEYPYIFHHRIEPVAGNVSIIWGLDDDGNPIMSNAKDAGDAKRILKRAGFTVIRERISRVPVTY